MRNIILTILIILSAVFTLQNMHPVELVFIIWSIHTTTALAIILALILGLLIGLFIAMPAILRNKRIAKQSKQELTALEGALSHQYASIKPDSEAEKAMD
ncbi:MAG: hypothetical protein CVU29_00080 [Betaproteobacteria bacterium HGW-Betaproteobacteria-22]|nr:MAG: hypothetical protein CVU29_00080 [Betaproteobacteria bacterium HGW-Betaproteobacteria-22]